MSNAHTGLSPEWARRPDEVFAELISHDDELVNAEFERLTRTAWPGSYLLAPREPLRRTRPARATMRLREGAWRQFHDAIGGDGRPHR